MVPWRFVVFPPPPFPPPLTVARSSTYCYRDATGATHLIHANEGVEQGDAFAPALFSYGLRHALARAQERANGLAAAAGCEAPYIFAYLDDIVLVADAAIAEEVFRVIAHELTTHCSLDVNPAKTTAWVASGTT